MFIQIEDDTMIEKISEIKTFMQSVRSCIFQAEMTHKYVYIELGIDASHWSKMMQGLAHFPPEKLIPLMTLCGNHIPLHWLAYQSGFELRALPRALEKAIEEKNKRIEILENKNAILEEILLKLGQKGESKNA